MPRKETKVYWLISRSHLEDAALGCGFEGILDMLRYDSANVECNPPDGYWMFSGPHFPTDARWNSFGIKVEFAGSEWDCKFWPETKARKEKEEKERIQTAKERFSL